MRRAVLLALTVPALACVAAGAACAQSAAADGKLTYSPAVGDRWIPFDAPENQLITFTGAVNQRQLTTMLDTGFPDITIDLRTARDLGLPLEPLGSGQSVGGVTYSYRAPIQSISLGGFSQVGGAVAAIDLAAFIHMVAHPPELVVGKKLFERATVEVDFDHQQLRLRLPGKPVSAGAVPIASSPDGQRIFTSLVIRGKRIEPVLIDTGSNNTLTLTPDTIAALDLHGVRTTDAIAQGAGGTTIEQLFYLPDIMLGDTRISEVETTAEAPGEFIARNGAKAAIGLGLLRRFNFTIDLPNRQMELAPRAQPEPEKRRATAGIQGLYRDDGLHVLHIMRGSPAAAAGMHDGDLICTVDGVRVSPAWEYSPQRRWSTDAAGRRVTLGYCDGRRATFTLARFY